MAVLTYNGKSITITIEKRQGYKPDRISLRLYTITYTVSIHYIVYTITYTWVTIC